MVSEVISHLTTTSSFGPSKAIGSTLLLMVEPEHSKSTMKNKANAVPSLRILALTVASVPSSIVPSLIQTSATLGSANTSNWKVKVASS